MGLSEIQTYFLGEFSSFEVEAWLVKFRMIVYNGSVALLSHFTSSEVRFLDLVFLRGAGCPGTLDPRSRDSLGNHHHAEKLSQRIALHFRKV